MARRSFLRRKLAGTGRDLGKSLALPGHTPGCRLRERLLQDLPRFPEPAPRDLPPGARAERGQLLVLSVSRTEL